MSEDQVTTLNALKGWASSVADVIERHEQALISGDDVELEPGCEEQPRIRLARMCHQIPIIHDTMVVSEIYDGEMPDFKLP